MANHPARASQQKVCFLRILHEMATLVALGQISMNSVL